MRPANRPFLFNASACVAIAISAVAAAGCGDDDNDSAAGSGEYCTTSLALETLEEPDIDFETASADDIAIAVKEWTVAEFLPMAQKLRAEAPDEVVEDIDIGIAGLNRLAETGDFEAAFTAEMDTALDRLHEFDLGECRWKPVKVQAADYAFQGVPNTIDAGPTSFEFTNGGTEAHEMVVFRINDDVTETAQELLALAEEEAMTKVTMVADAGGLPGESEYAVADLQPGRYAMVCFVPEGTTDRETEGTGQPHFMKGMVYEFTVA